MHTYLACFDISDDKQRRFVGNKLQQYGIRVQYSVFEISVENEAVLDEIKQELSQWIDTFDDIRFYHLCSACRAKSKTVDNQDIAEFPIAVVV